MNLLITRFSSASSYSLCRGYK